MVSVVFCCGGSRGDLLTAAALLEEPSVALRGIVYSPSGGSGPEFTEQLTALLGGGVPVVTAAPGALFRPDKTGGAAEHLETLSLLERAAGECAAVLSTGRLTELALFFLAYPRQACRFSGLYIAGGSVYSGNRTPAAENTFYEDPEAAQILTSRATGIHLLPLETAQGCTVSCSDGSISTPGLGLLLSLLDPQAVREEEHTLEVDLESAVSRGCSVIDWLNRDKELPFHRICLDVDRERFRTLAERAHGHLTKGGIPLG